MLGFDAVAGNIAANGVTSLVRRSVSSVIGIFQRSKQLKLQLDSLLHRKSILEAGLSVATRNFESITDHITHLDASSGAFDPEKVLVAAHTMRLFKAPMPTVQRSGRHTNALHIDCGRDHGIIPGISVSLKSRRGEYEETYIVQNRDIQRDHICAQPPKLNFSRTEVADLIVSFILAEALNPLENNLAGLLDMSMSGIDESRAAKRRADTEDAI